MPLSHQLCFVLPVVVDDNHDKNNNEIEPKNQIQTKQEIPPPSPQRYHTSFFLEFLHHNSIYNFLQTKWLTFRNHKTPKRQPSSLFHDTEGIQILQKIGATTNPRTFSYAELYIGSNGFNKDQVLGSGGFGRVYRTVLPSDGTVVAVKCLAEKGERFEKTFEAELVAMAHLRHRNLVSLRGWCVHDDQLLLVYDYMPNTSLDRTLFKKSGTLDWDKRVKIVNGLAAALNYLHNKLETQIIHRDVKTSNVMLDLDFNAKLGDFGLARWLEHDEVEYKFRPPSIKYQNYQFRLMENTKIGGTIGYLPPENFQRRGAATAKSDVFSFGIVVLEIVSGRRAVDLTYQDDEIVLLDWVRRLADEGMALQAGDVRLKDGSYKLADMERLIHLGLLCTLNDSEKRPNMKWVLEVLSGNLCAKLPDLPSFKDLPPYIAISSGSSSDTSNITATTRSSSTTTTTTTTTTSMTDSVWTNSTTFLTAKGETLYSSATNGSGHISPFDKRSSQRSKAFLRIYIPREISFKEVVSATNNFADSRKVAEAGLGTAYHGILDNQQHVLVKRLGMTDCSVVRSRFTNELQNLGKLRHRNLVQLRGWCTEQGEMMVMYDYSSARVLAHPLFHYNGKSPQQPILQWHQRYNIVKSLASAICYLHEEWDEQVIHKNITSSSIILDSDMNPRLGCFALAEFVTRNEQEYKVVADTRCPYRGMFSYMPPEFMESGEATLMTDIYSFGVVVLEVVSGLMAVDFSRPEVLLTKRVHEFEVRKRRYEELADLRLDGQYNHKELVRLVKVGMACTRADPKLRPGIRKIVSILDGYDGCFMEEGQKKETREDWKRKNASSLSLIKRVQGLGIH